MNRLITVVIGQNCKNTLKQCLESIKESDEIVYLSGGEIRYDVGNDYWFLKNDDVTEILKEYGFERYEKRKNRVVLCNTYDQTDKSMMGKQRNYYLDYVKRIFPNDWVLVLDADEVLSDNGIKDLKDFLRLSEPCVYSIHMRHFQDNLGWEDATKEHHYVPNRLFHVSMASHYPLSEHGILQPLPQEISSPLIEKPKTIQINNKQIGVYQELMTDNKFIRIGNCDAITIWHLAYCPNISFFKKRYDSHLLKSEIHSPEFLKQWYYSHLFGQYPKKQVKLTDIPKSLLSYYGIDKDELYFHNRGIETKHFIDAIHWREFFNPLNAVEFGCGRAPRVYALNKIGVNSIGFEISDYAIKNSFIPENTYKGNVINTSSYNNYKDYFDLVIAYDLLEHIPYEELNNALRTIFSVCKPNKFVLISVPMLGDPNLDADQTHIIRENKAYWESVLSTFGVLQTVPEHFLFNKQLFIVRKT